MLGRTNTGSFYWFDQGFRREGLRQESDASRLDRRAGGLIVLTGDKDDWYCLSQTREPPSQFDAASVTKIDIENDAARMVEVHMTPDGLARAERLGLKTVLLQQLSNRLGDGWIVLDDE